MRAAGLTTAALVLVAAQAATGHTPGLTAEENAWLDRQRSRDNVKCCDYRDVHIGRAVEWRMTGGHYQVRINGEWHNVPPERIMRINPDDPSPFGGEALLFYSTNPNWPGGFRLWCFRPESLT